MKYATWFCLAVMALATFAAAGGAIAAEVKTFSIADGKFEMTAPEGWVSKQPRTRIVEVEFEIPAVAGDELPGRTTVMGAGGSIEDNIDRWYGQFSQPDGSSTRDRAKVKKLTIAGQEVHMVDVAGTYDDSPPFAGGGVKRANYRMLAAIIATKDAGNYFIKFYGPAQTVAKHEAGFRKMVESLEPK